MKTNKIPHDCIGCKWATFPQGYFYACVKPEQLHKYKRMHYVQMSMIPEDRNGPCKELKVKE